MRIRKNSAQILGAFAMAASLLMAGCGANAPAPTNNTTNANAPRNANANTSASPAGGGATASPSATTGGNTSSAGNTSSGGASGRTMNITVRNEANYAIHHMYLSPTNETSWGPDQLRDEVIAANNGTFTLTGVPCQAYDIRLVDNDNDECIVRNVSVCNEASTWRITNEDLLSCQGFGQ